MLWSSVSRERKRIDGPSHVIATVLCETSIDENHNFTRFNEVPK